MWSDWHSSWEIIRGQYMSVIMIIFTIILECVSLTKSFSSLGVTIIIAVDVVIFIQISAVSFSSLPLRTLLYKLADMVPFHRIECCLNQITVVKGLARGLATEDDR